MDKILGKLKAQVEENPMGAVAVGALAVTAATKLLQAISSTRNSRSWAREVNRRVKVAKGK